MPTSSPKILKNHLLKKTDPSEKSKTKFTAPVIRILCRSDLRVTGNILNYIDTVHFSIVRFAYVCRHALTVETYFHNVISPFICPTSSALAVQYVDGWRWNRSAMRSQDGNWRCQKQGIVRNEIFNSDFLIS